jgi:hypothetical protein
MRDWIDRLKGDVWQLLQQVYRVYSASDRRNRLKNFIPSNTPKTASAAGTPEPIKGRW